MASIFLLESKVADLKARIESAKENLTRQEKTLDYYREKADAAKKENETLAPGSPQYIANEQIIAYQDKSIESLKRGSLKDAQDAVTGWTQQLTEAEKELSDEKTKTEKEKTEENAGQKVADKPAGETTKSENAQPEDKTVQSSTTTAGKTLAPTTAINAKAAAGKAPVPVSASSTSTSATAKTSNTGPGKRTYNPLGDFSSYTYRISLYAITPESYNRYKKTGIWESKELYLICQSGGSSTNPTLDSQRAAGFDLDFYIDDVEMTTNVNAKEVGLSTNTTFINFKVYEPFGATFPTKLVDAISAIQQQSDMAREVTELTEALWGHFLISMRFYGYDENGQLITSEKYNNGAFTKNLDSSATFERSFPIQIKEFKFKLEGKGQVYDIKTCTLETGEGLGTKRATFSFSKSANGQTVEEVLGGQGKTTNGIIDQLNKDQEELVKDKSQELADKFAIVFESSTRIGKSLLVDENINKDRVPMQKVNGSIGSNVRQSASASSGTMKSSRTVTVASGTSIIQAIDQIITQSSYVSDALKVIDSEEPQSVQPNEPTSDPNANPKILQWYIILPVTEVIGFDKKRNDYAFKVTYVIKTYEVPYVKSTAIKYVPKYPGPHKIYNYWYTGKNSEVISYEQQYDMQYYIYAGLKTGESLDNPPKGVRVVTKPANGADSTGKAPGSFEGPNSVKTFLYSENDQLKAKITILGDPDFLMPVTTGTIGQIMENWYGPDFTINPNTGQIFIELIFNQVEDYTNSNGLLEPNGNIDTMNFKFQPRPGIQEMVKGTVFMVISVKSKFSKGRFTQDFDTKLPNFADLDISNFTGKDDGGREGGSQNKSTGAGGTGAGGASGNNRTQNSTDEQQRLKQLQVQFRTGVNLNTNAGAGKGGQGGMTAKEAQSMPLDDQLVIAGPAYKKTYTQVNFYNGDLEREHAKVPDPANKSSRYAGLNSNAGGGRGSVNPEQINR